MSNTAPPQTKRLKTEDTAPSSQPQECKAPRSIVTWNCNGFVTRCKYSVPELQKLVRNTKNPDMICLQEARLKAHSSQNRGQPMASELQGPVEQVLNTVFADYTPFWSLADTRYAGTLTLLHHRFCCNQNQVQVAYSFDAAIDLLLKQLNLTRDQVNGGGLAKIAGSKSPKNGENNNNNNNNNNNMNAKKATQQKSISSFFKAAAKPASTQKTASKNKRPRSSFSAAAGPHHEEGRFQFFLFDNHNNNIMDIVQTYSPNHGMKMEKWEKRKEWDLQVLEFVRQRQLILDEAAKAKAVNNNNTKQHRSLLWCGDLNVAHQYMDGTHWEQRRSNAAGNQEECHHYEWWTDESKCIIDKKNRIPSKAPQYVGMPSFTPAERTRFSTWLETGNFVDVWRHLHPKPSQNWNAPEWTWRGKGGVYGNRGQRLDYFLLSVRDNKKEEEIARRVESCRILGTGNHKGLFCGSDHCASILVLKKEVEEEDHGTGAD